MWKCCLYFIRIMIEFRPPHPFNLTSLFLTNALLAYYDYFKTWWQRCVFEILCLRVQVICNGYGVNSWSFTLTVASENSCAISLSIKRWNCLILKAHARFQHTHTHTHVFLCNNFMMHLPLFLRFLWYDYVA